MSAADAAAPVGPAEAKALFSDLTPFPALVLAVSGGADSTALLFLAARWRRALRRGPALTAVTIDHRLRPESAREAAAVRRLARKLGVAHRTLAWDEAKPHAGLQQAARAARYRLLADAAAEAGARHVLAAHTLDDQAETVLLRLARGSGIGGLGAMARLAALPVQPRGGEEITLVRPLLDVPRGRLVATLEKAHIRFADDPSNRDTGFTRVRMRALLPAMAEEGLDARRLALLARRLRRADTALDFAAAAARRQAAIAWPKDGPIVLDARDLARLPAETRLRLLRQAVALRGAEGTVALGKLEALLAAFDGALAAGGDLRRTLAGALVSLADDRLVIEPAPPRRGSHGGRRP